MGHGPDPVFIPSFMGVLKCKMFAVAATVVDNVFVLLF